MARTRDEQGQRILEAASELLSKEGASALSVRRIAAAAGCSTMGLYSRFGGKDGVVDELYAEGFERLVEGMKGDVPTDDPVADLRRAAVCYRASAVANATHYMVVGKVARCTDAGLLEGPAEQITELLWASIHGLVMLELVGIDPLGSDPSARFSRALDALFDGFSHG